MLCRDRCGCAGLEQAGATRIRQMTALRTRPPRHGCTCPTAACCSCSGLSTPSRCRRSPVSALQRSRAINRSALRGEPQLSFTSADRWPELRQLPRAGHHLSLHSLRQQPLRRCDRARQMAARLGMPPDTRGALPTADNKSPSSTTVVWSRERRRWRLRTQQSTGIRSTLCPAATPSAR